MICRKADAHPSTTAPHSAGDSCACDGTDDPPAVVTARTRFAKTQPPTAHAYSLQRLGFRAVCVDLTNNGEPTRLPLIPVQRLNNGQITAAVIGPQETSKEGSELRSCAFTYSTGRPMAVLT